MILISGTKAAYKNRRKPVFLLSCAENPGLKSLTIKDIPGITVKKYMSGMRTKGGGYAI